VLSRVTTFIAAFRRARQASALMRTAASLFNEGRYAQATALLKQVRETADPPGSNWFLMGVQHMTRLRAATLLSVTAAKVGDTPSAVDGIEEGLRLWAEIKNHMRPSVTTQRFTDWETWAAKYLASAKGN
jgi:hypothetical protein